MFRIYLSLTAALCAVGCVANNNAPSSAVSATDTCSKAQYASLVGTQINDAVLPLSLTYRVIFPDTVATTDFVADRLEVAVNDDGVVTGLRCG